MKKPGEILLQEGPFSEFVPGNTAIARSAAFLLRVLRERGGRCRGCLRREPERGVRIFGYNENSCFC